MRVERGEVMRMYWMNKNTEPGQEVMESALSIYLLAIERVGNNLEKVASYAFGDVETLRNTIWNERLNVVTARW
jgi:hypothetical protein